MAPRFHHTWLQAVEAIRQYALPQETNALFTNVEGNLDDVLKVAGEATKLAEQGYRTSLCCTHGYPSATTADRKAHAGGQDPRRQAGEVAKHRFPTSKGMLCYYTRFMGR